MPFCQHCGSDVREDWAFCRECGRTLVADGTDEAATIEGAPQPPSSLIPSGASAVSAPSCAEAPSRRSHSSRHKWVWVALVASALVIVTGGVILASGGPRPRASQSGGPAQEAAQDGVAGQDALPPGQVVTVVTPPSPGGEIRFSANGLSRNQLVWLVADTVSGPYTPMTKNLVTGVEKALAHAGSFRDAGVAGGAVVWLDAGRANLQGVHVSRGRRSLTFSRGVDYTSSPDLSSSVVVWAGSLPKTGPGMFDPSPEAIFALSLKSRQRSTLCSRTWAWLSDPAVSGRNVVFVVDPNLNKNDLDIYGHDLRTRDTFVVCDAKKTQTSPAIDGNIVVWEDDRTGNWDVRGKNLATGESFIVCDALRDQLNPAVSGDIVVWEDWRSKSSVEIWGKNLATGETFRIATTTETTKGNPVAISGDLVAWQDGTSIRAVRLRPEWVGSSGDALASEAQTPAATDAGVVSWGEALSHVGERVTVEGLVISALYADSVSGEPTFLNMGRDYPASNRFQVVIWGEDRGSFPEAPESMYEGKTIRVTGEVSEYNGLAEIKVTSPNAIQVVE